MRGPFRLILFDLGNTVFYDDPAAWPGIYRRAEAALWDSLRAAGVKVAPEVLYGRPNTLLNYYYTLRDTSLDEPGTARVLKDLLAARGTQLDDRDLKRALRAMYAVTQSNWYLEEDAGPTIRILRERALRIGMVSNGSDDANALELLEGAGLLTSIEFVLTSAAFGRRKPDPGIFRKALQHFEASPAQAVMIGDSYEADILGAHGVGMSTIWVTRRLQIRPTSQPVAPDATVAALSEIPQLLS
jgi:putative hydrolase of the HAD superfamily